MPLVQWNESIAINIKEIDNQHFQLIEIINNLHDLIKLDLGVDVSKETLNRLKDYASYHFNYEEHLMEVNKYPEFTQHKVEHEYFIEKIKKFELDQSLDDKNKSIDLLNFLIGWLMNHIKVRDKKIAEFLKLKGMI